MTWQQRNPYYLASGCGRYTIVKTHGPPGTRYTAWHVRQRPAQLISIHNNAGDARNACQQHSNTEGKS